MTVTERLHGWLARRIVVLDGAIGAVTDPARLAAIHEAYLTAGADIIKTGTFQATTYEMNAAAARVARLAVDNYMRAVPTRQPLVAGVIGPLRGSPETVHAIHRTQARGLLDGGVDLLLVETIMGASQAHAAAAALHDELGARGVAVPLMFSATVDPSGALLTGETLEAFVEAVREAQPLTVGLNCARGARDIGPHLA